MRTAKPGHQESWKKIPRVKELRVPDAHTSGAVDLAMSVGA